MNILVVGAGFSGAVVARELAEKGHQCVVIDERYHVGGNAYDYEEDGIRIHKYGPHIFHTSNEKVVNWISKFTELTTYFHKVKAQLSDGRYVTLPVNKETKEIVGEENILDIFFRPYTKKMWNKTLDELDPSIISRVPIRDDDNELYFPNDKFHLMPKYGYTHMFNNILDHENITVKLNTRFDKDMEKDFDYIFNSMPIDVYFDYCHGELPYRSIKFHTVKLPMAKVLPVTTVNFTHNGPYTRVTEWKNMPNHGNSDEFTILTYEEPCDFKDNDFKRYYPVKDIDGKNREIYNKYKSMIDESKMKFIGRCGMYVYIDMHQAISSALSTVQEFLERIK
jgi:UDP-galactopyranose mutase